MDITVTMDAKEFEEFREFQRQRSTLERNVLRAHETLLAEHTVLCSAVKSAICEMYGEFVQGEPAQRRFLMGNKTAAAQALTMATRFLGV